MRIVTSAGILALFARAALAGYIVDLDGGDRMPVDAYWEDGNRAHLVRGGVDLSVPRDRIRRVRESTAPEDAPPPAHETPSPERAAPPTRADLEAARSRIEHHLLRVQQERFEAEARGESPRTLRRLGKQFERTQQRRRDVNQAIADAPAR